MSLVASSEKSWLSDVLSVLKLLKQKLAIPFFIFQGCAAILSTVAEASVKLPKIGLIVSLTRQDGKTPNTWGIDLKDGFILGLQERGKSSAEISIKDNSESAPLAMSAARQLVGEGVDLISGLSFSDQALMVKQVTEPVQIPFVTVLASASTLFSKALLTFSMASGNEAQASRLSEYLYMQRPIKTHGVGLIVARNCSYCIDLEKSLRAALQRRGIAVSSLPDILQRRPVSTKS
jgi:hypothetical protein